MTDDLAARLTPEVLHESLVARDLAHDEFHRQMKGRVYDTEEYSAFDTAGWDAMRAVLVAALMVESA